jgi:DNA-binding PadR family transcriptional regulator
MSRKTLTDLEGCVLGLIHVLGPCTAYGVRREFIDSPSPYWSGSAGAIYPVIERLRRRGWIRSNARATGRRRHRLHSLTPAGLAALRAWLHPPLSDLVIGVPSDPLRTRLQFLGALSRAGRAEFVAEAARRMTIHLEVVERDLARRRLAGDLYGLLVARGARAALRARQAWIRDVARALGGAGTRLRSRRRDRGVRRAP